MGTAQEDIHEEGLGDSYTEVVHVVQEVQGVVHGHHTA